MRGAMCVSFGDIRIDGGKRRVMGRGRGREIVVGRGEGL